MTEKSYYPLVRKWVQSEGYYCGGRMYCSGSDEPRYYENIGTKPMRVDVAGIRNAGTRYADAAELACAEAKYSDMISFDQVAQAYGYSLVSHRVYLAYTTKPDAHWDRFLPRIGLGFSVSHQVQSR